MHEKGCTLMVECSQCGSFTRIDTPMPNLLVVADNGRVSATLIGQLPKEWTVQAQGRTLCPQCSGKEIPCAC